MSKMTKVHLDARRLAEEAGLNVVHLGTSRGGHVEMVVEKEERLGKCSPPFHLAINAQSSINAPS